MMDREFEEHFVPGERIPKVPESISLMELYEVLDRADARGFVLMEDGKAAAYIDSVDLGRRALEVEFPFTYTVGQAVARLSPESFPIAKESVTDDEEWRSVRRFGGMAFRVDLPGRKGWFLNHERVMQTSTGKPVFVCANGHENSSPDHGRCSVCPAKLLSVVARMETSGMQATVE